MAMKDVDTKEFLARLGLDGDAAVIGRRILIEAGLTNERKQRMSLAKLPAAEEVIRNRLALVCHKTECNRSVADTGDGRQTLVVPPEHCEVCGGSDNRRAVECLARAMNATGKLRLLVVGGTPNSQQELANLLPSPCQLRTVSKDPNPSRKKAEANLAWADVAVIWASTPIGHKVTANYKGPNTITVAQRGVAALAQEVTRALSGD